ncbi:assimilatory sulfite reductase (NADPH) hemoprotein subunit [Buchnera aphidicola (Thelaxes californica)]|uniref:assimilatory sulfite reductase (NADPH) n=1 Tax=Buchnera aphidicola (Thelaxes californica) TaxID=1315998 RepID=A0A4D6YFH4_9GAMM|nr:assimilatory sulfite reductase (NADPH) hemoprotein subunit [Buchnera aphidicola]QCI26853.1 assimilatory sulfite reductase (NADPH) hemoprotein subunit [Buchnera aphidicola (Thelaxes californica)]
MKKYKNNSLVVQGQLSDYERMKGESNYLRGTISDDLLDSLTNGFKGDNFYLIRFHGMYQQDDRDLRKERIEQKLEPKYTMMLRCRLPGGVITSKQWLKIYDFALNCTFYKSIRLTNRQTFQLHGILKNKLKNTHKMLNEVGLDSLATANDVNRNVICTSNPNETIIHHQIYEFSKKVSDLLLPKTNAYAEIWLDKKKIFKTYEEEPILTKFYLPRKFKISIVIPPYNDIDIHANDMSLVAIIDVHNTTILGFNLLLGGGLSFEHSNHATVPAISKDIGFIDYKNIFSVIQSVVTIQRDWGDRTNRKQAKTRYTIKRVGLQIFKKEIEKRANVFFEKSKPYHFISRGDRFGWLKGQDQLWYYTLFIPQGRIVNTIDLKLGECLQKIAQIHKGSFRITANQNIIISEISTENKINITKLLQKYNIDNSFSNVRKNSMACVSFPTCPLAMAEAERVLDNFVNKLELLLIKYNINHEYIVFRITGCPNGCARALLAEIALVGKSFGKYNLYLGGNKIGTRIPHLYLENLDENAIFKHLDKLIFLWSSERQTKEDFGDFVIRKKIVLEVIDSFNDFWKK